MVRLDVSSSNIFCSESPLCLSLRSERRIKRCLLIMPFKIFESSNFVLVPADLSGADNRMLCSLGAQMILKMYMGMSRQLAMRRCSSNTSRSSAVELRQAVSMMVTLGSRILHNASKATLRKARRSSLWSLSRPGAIACAGSIKTWLRREFCGLWSVCRPQGTRSRELRGQTLVDLQPTVPNCTRWKFPTSSAQYLWYHPQGRQTSCLD